MRLESVSSDVPRPRRHGRRAVSSSVEIVTLRPARQPDGLSRDYIEGLRNLGMPDSEVSDLVRRVGQEA